MLCFFKLQWLAEAEWKAHARHACIEHRTPVCPACLQARLAAFLWDTPTGVLRRIDQVPPRLPAFACVCLCACTSPSQLMSLNLSDVPLPTLRGCSAGSNALRAAMLGHLFHGCCPSQPIALLH